MRPRGRRFEGLVVLVIFVLLSTTAASTASVVDFSGDVFDGDATDTGSVKSAGSVRLVAVGNGGERLWPYTSRAHSFDTLTLPINLVVEGNPARVRSLLVYSSDARWDETNESWQEGPSEQSPPVGAWGSATGADRYTYVDTGSDGGIWIDESMQLHDGTYFGSRVHLRLYGGGTPGDSWTAIQAHRDYWDWFRLRHTVTSLAGPQHTVERDLTRESSTIEVRRERFGNGGIIDADGWVSVFELAPPQLVSDPPLEPSPPADATESTADDGAVDATLQTIQTKTTTRGTAISLLVFVLASVGSVVTAATRWDTVGAAIERLRWSRLADYRFQRGLILFVALLSVPIFVRMAALGLEELAPNQPKVIAGLLYPAFAILPPLLAYRLPRGLSAEVWFGVAFVGYGAGLVGDFGLIGVAVVPIEIVLHRFALLVSLGLLAVVGQRRSDSTDLHPAALPLAIGLWVLLLAWPLLIGL